MHLDNPLLSGGRPGSRIRARGLLLLLLFLALGLPGALLGQGKEIGVVTFVKGEATLTRDNQRLPLQLDARLRERDLIETGPLGKVRLVCEAGPQPGTRVVPPGSRLDLAEILTPAKDDASAGLAPEILKAFLDSEKEGVKACGKRKPGSFLLVPWSKTLTDGGPIWWIPRPQATAYRLVLSELKGSLYEPVKEGIATFPPLLDWPVPPKGGGLFRLQITALRESQVLAEDSVLVSGKRDPALEALLPPTVPEGLEPDDITHRLVRASLLNRAGYLGEALQELIAAHRAVEAGQRPALHPRMTGILQGMGLAPAEVTSFLQALPAGK